MEQSGVWQDRACMFHTMFFSSYKTYGRVQGNVRLDEDAFGTFTAIKIQQNKRKAQGVCSKCLLLCVPVELP